MFEVRVKVEYIMDVMVARHVIGEHRKWDEVEKHHNTIGLHTHNTYVWLEVDFAEAVRMRRKWSILAPQYHATVRERMTGVVDV
jgi:hypothetical protein